MIFLHSFFWILLCLVFPLNSTPEGSRTKLKMLYNSLDPLSIAQHLAFYELYPLSPEGQKARQDAYNLLTSHSSKPAPEVILSPAWQFPINALIGLISKSPDINRLELNEEELEAIDQLASHLPNRLLAGCKVSHESELLNLPPHEIDLARGILLSQLGCDPPALKKIKSYEAIIDLMALQILARITLNASPKAKIHALNRFIFEEMGFRFPPHSVYAKDIDLYTFLPSVLDSRRGVCLGVSILYLCLAQRLKLNLEIVTPPGHIFVRWRNGSETINIETTARGIDLSDEEYLGMDTRSLQQRNLRETIGLAHFNEASVFWERQQYSNALEAYKKAQSYLSNDALLIELMGYTALLNGNEQLGKELLQQVVDYLPDYAVSKRTIAEDYLKGNATIKGIKAIFKPVDETRESLIEKKNTLEEALKESPKFREGLFSLAGTWLQLHRKGEALEILNLYHQIDPSNASVEYYLAALYADRFDFNNAWTHFRIAEKLAHSKSHHPKALLELKRDILECCPE